MPQTIELTNGAPLLTQEGDSTYIKAPVARIGVWSHPQYGTVEFSQRDFDQMVGNWQSNVMGHEPPLYLGHPTDTDALGGAPAIGFLEKLVQDGDTLFGLYDPVDKKALSDVEEGKYRYASCEVTRQASSKADGSTIGTLLTALALTNEPFLTGLPRVEVTNGERFADPLNTTRFVFSQISTTDVKDTPAIATMTQPQTPAQIETIESEPNGSTLVDTQLKSLAEENKVLRLELTDRDSKITALSDELSKVVETLSTHTETFRKQELSDKLKRLTEMNVSAATKEVYSQKLTAGMSIQEEETMFNLLGEIAATATQKFTAVKGAHSESNQTTVENPYADTMKELAAKAESLGRKFPA